MGAMAQIAIGAIPMPLNFRYRDVFVKGMPQHSTWDSFRIKHPPMPTTRWAKIFSPFDALKGFDEAISSKEEIYERRHELDDEEQSNLDRQLSILHNYTFNGRMARANRVMVSVTSFVPAEQKDFFGGSERGKYIETTGMVLNVDEIKETLTLETLEGKAVIGFSDILEIEPKNKNLFEDAAEWQDEWEEA